MIDHRDVYYLPAGGPMTVNFASAPKLSRSHRQGAPAYRFVGDDEERIAEAYERHEAVEHVDGARLEAIAERSDYLRTRTDPADETSIAVDDVVTG